MGQSGLMQTNPTTTTTASFLLILLVATPAFSQNIPGLVKGADGKLYFNGD